MRLIIAGSRHLNVSAMFVHDCVRSLGLPAITEVVDGGARGIDTAGRAWATSMDLPVRQFLADWNKLGTAAGPARNGEMARYAGALLLIWDGESRGSANMRQQMADLGKPIYEVVLRRTAA